MTGWQHVELPTFPGMCAGCIDEMAQDSMTDYPHGIQLPCTTPTPDPTSPCGRLDCHWSPAVAWPHAALSSHPHIPTRCTCGHPIEATR